MIGGLLWLAMIFCRDASRMEGYNERYNEKESGVDLRESVAVGIDLGTTYSCICVWKPSTKDTEFVYAESGEETSPSVVNFTKELGPDGKSLKYEAVAGWPGSQRYNADGNANAYFYAFKRAMGIDDLSNIDKKVEEIKNNASVPIFVENVGGKRRVAYKLQEDGSNEYQSVTPEELSSHVLSMLKSYILKDYNIEGLTITVPAYFNLNQEAATREAAKLAGLPTPIIWKEPAAAAFAYTHDLTKKGVFKNEDLNSDMSICVFDLGGGTFDVSIVEPSDKLMMVMVYEGDNYLGGENVNDNLTKYFADYIRKQVGFDVMANQNVKLRLRNIVESMKIELCNKVRESPGRKSNELVSRPFIYEGEKSVELSLSNEKFNELNEGFYMKIRNVMNRLLNQDGKGNGGYDKNLVSRVLLVGGSTRIPKVIDIVEEIFGAKKIHYEGVDADTIVARGAALHTAQEIGMLADKIQTIDTIPLSLGICTEEDRFDQIIAKGEFIPAHGSKEFTTASDNQTKVRIRLAQGGMESFKQNIYIGDIEVDLPGNQPKGMPRIEVSIDMGSDGKIQLRAEDKQTGKNAKADFDSNVAKMTPQDIKRMEERVYSEENRELKAKRDVIRQFEHILDMTDKGEDFNKIPEEVKKDALEHIAKMKLWLEKNKESLSRVEIEHKLQQFVDEMKGYVPSQPITEEVPSQPVPEEKEAGREEL
ncbi:Hsp70-like protein [Ordospora colligata OC4]|uniref:Hsp70-like protein n=1 Tax=Ordospora colligata OC4 TaxID=1354746 RepID=A0A0B2ULY6_9MICR|nr:Hsp70-like protein [Ordospora colligata OC4]KHN70244.1 Hsp70-like protein [Ordospora colligata OC4]TBU16788.1 Hsp70-like protein [Ordospora colligata]